MQVMALSLKHEELIHAIARLSVLSLRKDAKRVSAALRTLRQSVLCAVTRPATLLAFNVKRIARTCKAKANKIFFRIVANAFDQRERILIGDGCPAPEQNLLVCRAIVR